MEWEDYQRWMVDAFKHMYQASEIEKLESISAAYNRREQWLQEEALRSAKRDALRAEK
jgi:lysine/ornithine N-monooxygenase